MKKGCSIFLSLMMMAAVLHLSVATHYCGGKEAASSVSVTGKLADCGMAESKNELALSGTNFTRHCCEDVVTFLGTDSNYAPSFSFVPDSFQNNFQVLTFPVKLSAGSYTGINPFYSNANPPGVLMSTSVDLSGICVFRI